jgi:hypothetical protein
VAVPPVRGGLRGLDAVQGLRELPLVRGYGREHAHQVLGGLHQPAGGPPRPRHDADAGGVRLRPLRDVRSLRHVRRRLAVERHVCRLRHVYGGLRIGCVIRRLHGRLRT